MNTGVFVPSQISDLAGLSNALASNRQAFATNTILPAGFHTPQTGTGVTIRTPHLVVSPVSSLQLYYVNSRMDGSNGDTANANDISIKASLEDASGNLYPVFFNGQRTAILNGGGAILSDPVEFDATAGTTFYDRTFVSVASSTLVYPFAGTPNTGSLNKDITDGGASDNTAVFAYGPAAIVAITPQQKTVVGIVADSIGDGEGDSAAYGWYRTGFIIRALQSVSPAIPSSRNAMPGDRFSVWVNAFNRKMRVTPLLLSGITHAVCAYGTNDVSDGNSLATLQSNALKGWFVYSRKRIKVFQCTIMPRNTSTDGWTTLANQAVASTNGVRVGFNDWVRDGAPINSSGVAVAVGTTAAGTLRAGAVGHPLTGYFEIADTVESARNSGKWRVDLGVLTADGTHPNTAGHTQAATGIDTTRFKL